MPNTVVWRHYSGVADSKGVCWVSSANSFGTHAISGGGFAAALVNANDSDTSTSGSDSSGMVPIAGMYSSYDSGTNTTYWVVGFAAPPGTDLRTHVFAVLA